MNHIRLSLTALCAVCALLITLSLSSSIAAKEKLQLVDDLAIDPSAFIFVDASEQTLSLADYEDQWVVVNFWATWCTPCVAELPSLSAFQKHYDERVTVLTLSQGRDTHAKISAFFDSLDIDNLPSLIDPQSASFRKVKARGLPTSLVINPEGEAIAKIEGEIDWMAENTLARFDAWLGKEE